MADYQYDGQARSRYVAKAEAWTERQAARLGYSTAELLAAVRRGWTPDRIERLAVAEAYRLESRPGLDPETLAKLKGAPILPVRLSRYEARQHDRVVLTPRAA